MIILINIFFDPFRAFSWLHFGNRRTVYIPRCFAFITSALCIFIWRQGVAHLRFASNENQRPRSFHEREMDSYRAAR